MNNNMKTNEQQFHEVEDLCRRIPELEKSEIEHKQADEELELIFTFVTDTHCPDMLCIASPDGYFKKLNPVWEKTLGFTIHELLAKPFADFIHPDDLGPTKAVVERKNSNQSTVNFVNRYRCKDGSYRWLEWRGFPSPNGRLLYGAARDITERKRAEDALQQAFDELEQHVAMRTEELRLANEELRAEITERKQAEKALHESQDHHTSLMESASNFAVYRLMHNKKNPYKLDVVFVSPSIKEIMGVSDPMKFQSWFEIVHPDDRERVEAANLRAFETRKFNESCRFFHHRKNEWRWIHAISNGVFDEKRETRYVNGILIDITDKKKAEAALREAYKTLEQNIMERTTDLQTTNEKLQHQIEERKLVEADLIKSKDRLKYLANRLINAQENERKRIAYELHDELGQALVGLTLQLSGLKKKATKMDNDFTLEITQALSAINGMIQNVRRLTLELRPSVLEHLGLLEALQWLCEDFSKKYRINIINSIKEIKMKFPKDRGIIIFRIFQEALFNIGKHAKATHVTIAMTDDGESAVFSIKDDGKGFNVKEVKGRDPLTTGLGLAAMNERAVTAGGTFGIKSEPGKGTTITFAIQKRRIRKNKYFS